MHLQHGTRADILARTQRLGETFRRPPAPEPIEAAQPRLAPEIPDAPAIMSDADLDVDVVRAVQRELAHRGYEPGAADGLVHPVTRAAVMAYEHDHGLPLTGQPTEDLLKAILFGVPASDNSRIRREPLPQAQDIIRSVQDSLASLGYEIATDGRMGEETARAIRAFEAKHGLNPSGRISGALMLKLRDATVRRQRRASTR